MPAQLLPRDKTRRTPPPGTPVPLVVGVALRGVHALAISAKGFEGVGPVFRVDATVDSLGTPKAQAGKVGASIFLVNEMFTGGQRYTLRVTLCNLEPPGLMHHLQSGKLWNFFAEPEQKGGGGTRTPAFAANRKTRHILG